MTLFNFVHNNNSHVDGMIKYTGVLAHAYRNIVSVGYSIQKYRP